MANAYKNQHVVPQAYLKRFAQRNGDKHIIGTCIVSNSATKFVEQSIDKVAYIRNYYDTQTQDDPKYWEHHFDKCFDTLCGRRLGNLLSRITLCPADHFSLSHEEIHLLAQIVLSQVFRVPNYLDAQIILASKTISDYKNSIRSQITRLSDDLQRKIMNKYSTVNELKDFILERSFDTEQFELFSSILEQKKWIILYNRIHSLMPFTTSDNPVLMFNSKGKIVKLTEIGLANTQLSIYFPLSPSVAVLAFSFNNSEERIANGSMRIFNCSDLKPIMDLNLLQKQNSNVHCFLPKPLFEMAKGDLSL